VNLERYPGSRSDRPRSLLDDRGIEWEVYDEREWSIALALDWSIQAQTENPGLIFVSEIDRRRLWPCPSEWQRLSDADLLRLLDSSKPVS
jgi:hypothetical protein